MNGIIGACGFISTGSSAVTDLLREFSETQILDSIEFVLTYFPDGLEDLEYHLNDYHKYMASVVAINRFRRLMKWRLFRRAGLSRTELNGIVNKFLEKIIQLTWVGCGFTDTLLKSKKKKILYYCVVAIIKILKLKKLPKLLERFALCKMELSIMPVNLEASIKEFISEILDAMGRDIGKITILDQPFEGCNPVKSFKYFENPKAVIVSRDPRDQYLFTKKFLRTKGGSGYIIPCDNVDVYIEYYKRTRQHPEGLYERDDVLFMNFEELIYDYENAIIKVAEFCDVKSHIHKGEYFKPTHSRNNTQLFKKYKGFEEDIAKIEKELREYLFDFENYPDVESEGTMFFGSQSRKQT